MTVSNLKIHILINGSIHSMDPTLPRATALAYSAPYKNGGLDGKILALGDDESIQNSFGNLAVDLRDLQGRTVLPGLTDAHVHLEQFAFTLANVECETETKEECLQRVADRAKTTPKGEWILGHGWAQAEWPGGFGRAQDLDAAAPDHPVYLTAKSLHAGWANSAALKQARIDRGTPDPTGGQIQRSPDGEATGILFELAMNLVSSTIPKPDVDASITAIHNAQPELWKIGLTGIHDFDRQRCFAALQELEQAGELRLRVLKNLPVEVLDEATKVGLRSGFGSNLLRIGGIKAFSDGALGPKTAAMLEPFMDDPENTGILLLDREELFEFGRQATASGLSMTVHAIGDRANHEVIAAYEQIRTFERDSDLPRRRHRIEHVQLLHPGDIQKLAASGVIASMQPIHATSDMVAADQSWGARAETAYAWQTLLSEGIPLAFGSDAPVDSPNPFWGLHAAVTRRRRDGSPGPEGWYPQQRLDLATALGGFTIGPAYAAGMEDRLGALKPGYLADFIILADDPFEVEPEQLWSLKLLATVIGGEWVYSTMD